jgi:hypothetical protein
VKHSRATPYIRLSVTNPAPEFAIRMAGTDSTLALLISFGPRLVGLAFAWAGIVKALEPHIFAAHLRSLGVIPERFVTAAVTLAAAFETGLGAVLIVGTAPAVFHPSVVAILAIFSALTWWSIQSGRTTDCGCYGGYVQPSLGQSLALNGVYALLIAAAIAVPSGNRGYETWQLVLPVLFFAGAAAFTEGAHRYPKRHGKPLVDLNPLKEGRRFRDAWTQGLTTGTEREVIVAFLGPDCPYCGLFVKVANAMLQSNELPRVVGVVATSADKLQKFKDEKGIRFPVAVISKSLFSRLVGPVPTGALVSGGIIQRVWVGNMPPDLVDRFRDAFFPVTVKGAPPRNSAAGDGVKQLAN